METEEREEMRRQVVRQHAKNLDQARKKLKIKMEDKQKKEAEENNKHDTTNRSGVIVQINDTLPSVVIKSVETLNPPALPPRPTCSLIQPATTQMNCYNYDLNVAVSPPALPPRPSCACPPPLPSRPSRVEAIEKEKEKEKEAEEFESFSFSHFVPPPLPPRPHNAPGLPPPLPPHLYSTSTQPSATHCYYNACDNPPPLPTQHNNPHLYTYLNPTTPLPPPPLPPRPHQREGILLDLNWPEEDDDHEKRMQEQHYLNVLVQALQPYQTVSEEDNAKDKETEQQKQITKEEQGIKTQEM